MQVWLSLPLSIGVCNNSGGLDKPADVDELLSSTFKELLQIGQSFMLLIYMVLVPENTNASLCWAVEM